MLRWWNVLAHWQLYAVLRCWHGWGGVGWGGIIASMYACGTSWCYVDEMLPKAWWRSPWSTCIVNGLGRCECGEERKLQEPNKLIVVGNISKKIAPVKWRTALAQQSRINARFWDRIYQWIYRHNMSKWDIASRCEMKKSLCKLFVVSWQNCWFEKWQNVRRFDTLMSKTHGCFQSVLRCWCGYLKGQSTLEKTHNLGMTQRHSKTPNPIIKRNKTEPPAVNGVTMRREEFPRYS